MSRTPKSQKHEDQLHRLTQENKLLHDALQQAQRAHRLYNESINTLKVAEKEIKKSDAFKTAILDMAMDCIISIDQKGCIVEFNAAAEKTFGRKRRDVLGKELRELIIPPSLRKNHHRGLSQYLKTGKGVFLNKVAETMAMRADGSEFPVEISITEVLHAGEKLFTGFIRDISGRKKTEERLHMLSLALRQAGEAIIITNAKGAIKYVNAAFTHITGYTRKEVVGKSPNLLKNDPESQSLYYPELLKMVSGEKIWSNKVMNRKKDGSVYTAMQTITPIFNEAHEITHYVDIQRDISEYESLQEQLRQAQKMEALGTLVGGIAHDFNNILAGMTGNMYLAKSKCRDRPEVMERLGVVEILGFRAADMISQLLTFARKGVVQMQALPLEPFLNEALKMAQVSIPENITFRRYISRQGLVVNGDAVQLQQVLMNLLNNARDAVAAAGKPMITVRLQEWMADADFMKAYPDVKASRLAHLMVKDNGYGIPADCKGNIFEPFFTTKEVGKGTGLGLAMVYGAVQSHGGVLRVDSEAGRGTCVHMYFPLINNKPKSSDDAIHGKIYTGRGETILLADDEVQLRQTSKHILESLGYRVLEASDGKEAVDIFFVHSDEVELLVLDVMMPRMGGVEVADRIHELKPDIPLIFATGYDREVLPSDAGQLRNHLVLSKPFSIQVFSKGIRDLLDGHGGA